MFNSQRPSSSDLPTNRQLVKATAFALVTATVLLVTVVLPAEYAIDPTGAGRLLGYSEMGEIKQQLAAEAAADEQNTAIGEVRTLAGNSDNGAEAATTRTDIAHKHHSRRAAFPAFTQIRAAGFLANGI